MESAMHSFRVPFLHSFVLCSMVLKIEYPGSVSQDMKPGLVRTSTSFWLALGTVLLYLVSAGLQSSILSVEFVSIFNFSLSIFLIRWLPFFPLRGRAFLNLRTYWLVLIRSFIHSLSSCSVFLSQREFSVKYNPTSPSHKKSPLVPWEVKFLWEFPSLPRNYLTAIAHHQQTPNQEKKRGHQSQRQQELGDGESVLLRVLLSIQSGRSTGWVAASGHWNPLQLLNDLHSECF